MSKNNILTRNGDLKIYEPGEAIDVRLSSDEPLGRMLSPLYKSTIVTELGTFNSIKSFMNYLTVPNYPAKYNHKAVLDKKEERKLYKKNGVKFVPNYYALVAYALLTRISKDKKLMEMLKENNKPFTSTVTMTAQLFGSEPRDYTTVNLKMMRYIAVIRLVSEDIKAGKKIDKKYIEDFVTKCKDKPDQDLLEGAAFITKAKEQAEKITGNKAVASKNDQVETTTKGQEEA